MLDLHNYINIYIVQTYLNHSKGLFRIKELFMMRTHIITYQWMWKLMWNKKLNFPKRVEIYCIYEQGWVSFNVCSYLLWVSWIPKLNTSITKFNLPCNIICIIVIHVMSALWIYLEIKVSSALPVIHQIV